MNYDTDVTIRKTYEVNYDKGGFITPMIIVCSDPPHNDSETNFMNITDHYESRIPNVKNMQTIFKVCSMFHTNDYFENQIYSRESVI